MKFAAGGMNGLGLDPVKTDRINRPGDFGLRDFQHFFGGGGQREKSVGCFGSYFVFGAQTQKSGN